MTTRSGMSHQGQITLDVLRWPRLADVYDYATQRAIPLESAVQELVNRGLSHVAPPWQLPPIAW
jgi:hypothetical protein